jgi:hypothetical protein
MALMACRACGKYFNALLLTCPNCGKKMQSSNVEKIAGVIFLIFVLGYVARCASGTFTSAPLDPNDTLLSPSGGSLGVNEADTSH